MQAEVTDRLVYRYCRRCGATLPFGRIRRCLTCDCPFDPADPKTFHLTSPFLRPGTWLPGAVLGCALFMVVFAIAELGVELPSPVLVLLPFVFGFVLGATMTPSLAAGLVLLAFFLNLVRGVSSQERDDVLALGILWILFLPLSLGGIGVGYVMRRNRLSGNLPRTTILGLGLAAGIAVGGVWLAGHFEAFGWPLFVVLPAVVGSVLGFTVPARVGIGAVLAPIAFALIVGLYHANEFAGIFYPLTVYGLFFLAMAFAGFAAGSLMRRRRERGSPPRP